MMVSIKDIAKAVGVSPAAVSLVLNGKAKQSRISDDLSAKIEAAALQMGYRPNRVAIGLRTGKSKTLGLIIENIANNFFSTLAKTVEDEARKFGYNVVYCSTENDPVRGSEMVQMLYNQQVDGYLITP
ncbi:MAG: LacI family transcriptional regulator, partial [Chitinophagaceae bacterium]